MALININGSWIDPNSISAIVPAVSEGESPDRVNVRYGSPFPSYVTVRVANFESAKNLADELAKQVNESLKP